MTSSASGLLNNKSYCISLRTANAFPVVASRLLFAGYIVSTLVQIIFPHYPIKTKNLQSRLIILLFSLRAKKKIVKDNI